MMPQRSAGAATCMGGWDRSLKLNVLVAEKDRWATNCLQLMSVQGQPYTKLLGTPPLRVQYWATIPSSVGEGQSAMVPCKCSSPEQARCRVQWVTDCQQSSVQQPLGFLKAFQEYRQPLPWARIQHAPLWQTEV
mmetsp:Transcript_52157/g.121723  ORF Transcript_52157/g.121723 Transcript_52157/m.121723 type:complete len:134 (+) Transcript_52157:303-704(+)